MYQSAEYFYANKKRHQAAQQRKDYLAECAAKPWCICGFVLQPGGEWADMNIERNPDLRFATKEQAMDYARRMLGATYQYDAAAETWFDTGIEYCILHRPAKKGR